MKVTEGLVRVACQIAATASDRGAGPDRPVNRFIPTALIDELDHELARSGLADTVAELRRRRPRQITRIP